MISIKSTSIEFISLFYICYMANRIKDVVFPSGMKTIYVNGKRYTLKEFQKAQQLEKRRGKDGRFR